MQAEIIPLVEPGFKIGPPQPAAQRDEAIDYLKTFGKMHGLSLSGMTIRECAMRRVRE
jgi:hypothetical protein